MDPNGLLLCGAERSTRSACIVQLVLAVRLLGRRLGSVRLHANILLVCEGDSAC